MREFAWDFKSWKHLRDDDVAVSGRQLISSSCGGSRLLLLQAIQFHSRHGLQSLKEDRVVVLTGPEPTENLGSLTSCEAISYFAALILSEGSIPYVVSDFLCQHHTAHCDGIYVVAAKRFKVEQNFSSHRYRATSCLHPPT